MSEVSKSGTKRNKGKGALCCLPNRNSLCILHILALHYCTDFEKLELHILKYPVYFGGTGMLPPIYISANDQLQCGQERCKNYFP